MARGQTTQDFAIGISLFLLVLVGVFTFLPSVFAPFAGDGGASLVVADRSASKLSEETLTAPMARPSVLDATCTEDFFNTTGTDAAECNFATDAADLPRALGFDERRRQMNVSVVEGDGVRNVDTTSLRAGEPVPSTGDVVTASRVVLLEGEESRLVVRVW